MEEVCTSIWLQAHVTRDGLVLLGGTPSTLDNFGLLGARSKVSPRMKSSCGCSNMQEFLANQEQLRPQEERNQEDRAKVLVLLTSWAFVLLRRPSVCAGIDALVTLAATVAENHHESRGTGWLSG